MLMSLALAAFVSLISGIAFLQARALDDRVALLGVAASIALGPLILWRRGTKPLIPTASIFCVLMLLILLYVDFVLAWRRGLVDL